MNMNINNNSTKIKIANHQEYMSGGYEYNLTT